MGKLIEKDGCFYSGAVKVPRLTEIIQSLGIVDYSSIPKKVRDFSMRRGTLSHRACELYDLGTLNEETLDPQLVPYLDGWKKAVSDLKLTFKHIEERLFNETYWYTTCPDRIGLFDEVPCVVEIKSGKVQPWTALQLSAQAACLPSDEVYLRIAIGLPGNGTYTKHFFTDRNDRNIILGGISLYNWKNRNA